MEKITVPLRIKLDSYANLPQSSRYKDAKVIYDNVMDKISIAENAREVYKTTFIEGDPHDAIKAYDVYEASVADMYAAIDVAKKSPSFI